MTYSLAGQRIAVRVTGDPAAANNGLHYLYADHLGGINAIQRQNGTLEQMRYTPFGGYRTGNPSQITDRGFTGQRENMDLGLYYYNARYYLPGAGRFLSADTLVPDPQNPQSLNRYAYALNSPLNYSDPTGHCAENGDEECWSFAELISSEYGIDLAVIGILNINQMRFFVEGLNASRGINNDLPQEIIDVMNGMDSDTITFLRQANFDVLGIRLEGGGGFIVGGQGDLDIIFNFDSWETSIMLTPGVQFGVIAGASAGVGVYAGFNTSKNSDLWGWGWGITASFASGPGGAIQYNNSGGPWSLVVGGQGGEELDVSGGVGYTFELLNYVGNPSGTSPGYITWFPQWYYLQGWLAGRK